MTIPKEIRNNYIRTADEKLTTLDQLWHRVQADPSSPADMDSLKAFCHRLAGSGGSYGFHSLGNAARSFETSILSRAGMEELANRFDLLRTQLVDFAKTPLE